MCHNAHVEIRELLRIDSLFLPCRFLGLTSGCQAWQEVNLPSEPSCWSCLRQDLIVLTIFDCVYDISVFTALFLARLFVNSLTLAINTLYRFL